VTLIDTMCTRLVVLIRSNRVVQCQSSQIHVYELLYVVFAQIREVGNYLKIL